MNGNLDQGPYDQSSLDSRSDIVFFETEVLDAAVTVSGRISLDVFVSSDQPDCDIAVRLVDHYPDGRSMLITDGIKRMRFRNGYAKTNESFMTAGLIYNTQVDLPFTCYTWETGHRIKIYLSGNHASRFDVNLQNGDSMYVAGDTNTANISIHHDAASPSTLILPGNNPVLDVAETTNKRLVVYPNPATVELIVPEDFVGGTCEITNSMGQILIRDVLTSVSIDVRRLHSGAYSLKLVAKDRTVENTVFLKE